MAVPISIFWLPHQLRLLTFPPAVNQASSLFTCTPGLLSWELRTSNTFSSISSPFLLLHICVCECAHMCKQHIRACISVCECIYSYTHMWETKASIWHLPLPLSTLIFKTRFLWTWSYLFWLPRLAGEPSGSPPLKSHSQWWVSTTQPHPCTELQMCATAVPN